jgi:eukaryotic-like serine/threonine-protein kinase
MNEYPSATDYYKAVQSPSHCFTIERLRTATFATDELGLPIAAKGSSAVVFKADVDGDPRAVRCYVRSDASSRDRYGALGSYLVGHGELSPHLPATMWLDDAIRVNGVTWPVLQMGWVDGRTLEEYVKFLVDRTHVTAITALAARWRELVARMQDDEFAHGDLQHGNIMINQEGRLCLVDFDGIWIPELSGLPAPTEFGHRNYQHPGRQGASGWGRWIDTFSALVIYLSLVALGKDPGLWLPLYNKDNLLLETADFYSPFSTQAWVKLAALRDREVDLLAARLQTCCAPTWVPDQSLEAVLEQQRTRLARQESPLRRWWEEAAVPTTQAPASSWEWAVKVPASAASAAEPATVVLPPPPPLSSSQPAEADSATAQRGSRAQSSAGTSWWAGPPAPSPSRPPAQPQRQVAGGLLLGVGLLLIIIGVAAIHSAAIVIFLLIGLAFAGLGAHQLRSGSGKSGKPPGKT